MNCTAVRDRLTERALGALPSTDGNAVDRHLAWCAACRKEAGELDRAAATLAFAVAPADPVPDLEDRVAGEIGAAAAKGRPTPRHGRFAVALAVAAMVAVSALGWGAVMAGRAARFAETAAQQEQHSVDVTRKFADYLNTSEFNDPGNEVFIGTLASATRGGTAAGSALTLVSPGARDVAIVMVNGLRPAAGTLPMRVLLLSEHGRSLSVGQISTLDSGGSTIIFKRFDVDLSRFTGIEVRDRSGAVVLQGSVELRPAITTPSP